MTASTLRYAMRTSRERRRYGRRGLWRFVVASVALHVTALLLGHTRWPEPPPDEPKIMEIALIRPGDGPEEGVEEPAPVPASPTPGPSTRATPPSPRPAAPSPPTAALHAPSAPSTAFQAPLGPSGAMSAPSAPSFREWQRSRRGLFPTPEPVGRGGSPLGTDLAQRIGRDRCEPDPRRRADLLVLLFDASGSMDGNGRAQALSCAQQYALAAVGRGERVIVGAFGADAVFSEPTTDVLGIQASLRAAVDATRTVLPTQELARVLEASHGASVDLVVVSDGWFYATPEIVNWYRYFLAMNHENRGTMYTVANPGAAEAVAQLRILGFDVYEYQQMRAASTP